MRQMARRLSAVENIRVTFQSAGQPKTPGIEPSFTEVLQQAFDRAAIAIEVHEAFVEWQYGAVVPGSDSGSRTVIVAAAVAGGLIVLCAVGLLIFLRCVQR